MQIIVNCLVPWNQGFVMLQKPRRGWWFLPGGKVEQTETWPEAARREVFEETGLQAGGLSLRGVYLLQILASAGADAVTRTIVQFSADFAEGTLLENTREGILRVITEQEIEEIDMDLGDFYMLRTTLQAIAEADSSVMFGKFTYTAEHRLLDWSIHDTSRLDMKQRRSREENHSS